MPFGKLTVRPRTESAASWGATAWMLAAIEISSPFNCAGYPAVDCVFDRRVVAIHRLVGNLPTSM